MSSKTATSHDPTATNDKATHRFEAEVHQVLRLVIDSLYTSREVFLRELISNASDAIDKRRFRAVTSPELLPPDEKLLIRIEADKDKNTLTIWDNGVGMSKDELVSHLGTIARSGSKQFVEQIKKAKEEAKGDGVRLIGQFGVGFYSAFLVADRVEVTSLSVEERQAFKWASDAHDSFTVESARRAEAGTTITLYLKEDAKEFLEEYRLRELVRRYSDYLAHPIELVKTGEDGRKENEGLNQGKALWQRNPSELDDEQYHEFYKHLGHDWEAPLTHKHFRVEGTQEFVGLLFVPKQRPMDLFAPDASHGLRLHVRRVLVMEECKEILPPYLRFVRGVVDSEDLPLNVSRETLQDSAAVRVIRKQVARQTLDLLGTLAKEKPELYQTFWKAFGPVLKEGLHLEPKQRDRLVPLLRYVSSKTMEESAIDAEPNTVSLAEYKARMPEGQKAIYYMLGDALQNVHQSPHLEILKKRGFEVLYMTDAVDSWAVTGIGSFEDLPLVSASDTDLKLEGEEDEKKEDKDTADAFASLAARVRVRLQDQISEVRVSKRLTESPVCLVVPEGGLPPVAERLLRAASRDIPTQKRVLEVNPDHKVIKKLEELAGGSTPPAELDQWIDVLYEQALLAEGSPLQDPSKFARNVTGLLEQVVG